MKDMIPSYQGVAESLLCVEMRLDCQLSFLCGPALRVDLVECESIFLRTP